MLDIIAHLETNEHVSIVEVQRPRCCRCAMARRRSSGASALADALPAHPFRNRSAKVEALISDLAVRAQSKYSEVRAAAAARLCACADAYGTVQIGAASETLSRASAALRVSAERSRRFFAELAELQHTARLLPASEAPSAHASFLFDVSFPGVRAPPAEVHVLVGPSDTVRLRPRSPSFAPSASDESCAGERVHNWRATACGGRGQSARSHPRQESGASPQHTHAAPTVRRVANTAFLFSDTSAFREEVGAISATDPTGIMAALEAELQLALKARSEGAELSPMARAWLRLTDSFFLEVLAWTAAGGAAASGTSTRSEPPRVLPRLLSHLQHAACARRTHMLLVETASALRGSGAGAPGLPLVLLRHNTGDPLVSAWELGCPGLPPVSVVLRGADLHIEGVRTDESLDLPAAGIKVTPSWLAFWVADSICKHVLNALRQSAAAAGVEVVSGRRHVRTVGVKYAVRIAGRATREGASGC